MSGLHRATWMCVLSGLWPMLLQAAPTAGPPLDIRIYPQEIVREVSPRFMGAALSPAVSRELLKSPAVLLRLKEMGIKTVCFPAGCHADTYNWANPGADQLSMDEFLEFCDAIGATACYIVNMQGGTAGLEGSPPPTTDVDDHMRYRHAPPSACGAAQPYFGTLDEAVALVHSYTVVRATEGKPPLKRFILGHDHWQRSGADWPADVYVHTAQAFAQAMLQELISASEQQPKLAEIEIDYTELGYPMPKGGYALTAEAERTRNVNWTKQVNLVSGLMGAVQEPLPVFEASGAAAVRQSMNAFTAVLAVRYGLDSDQPGDYTDPELRYEPPMAWMIADTPEAARGMAPPTATHPANDYARQLYHVSVLHSLLGQATPYVCLNELVGTSATALLQPSGEERSLARPLHLLAGRVGKQLVRTTLRSDAAAMPVRSESANTDLAVVATQDEHELYVFLVNRSPDQPAATSLFLPGCTLKPDAELRTLTARGLETATLPVKNPVRLTVPPFAAQVLRLGLEQVIRTPLITSKEKFQHGVRFGESPAPETFTLSVMAPGQEFESASELVSTAPQSARCALHVDADWLDVSPTVGWITFLQPQDIDITYHTGRLPPGRHTATISILSPDAYNSPKALPVEVTVRTVRADFDADGDVDADDFQEFLACMNAAPAVQAGPQCAHARLTNDERVDVEDFAVFARCFSGPGQKPGEECPE